MTKYNAARRAADLVSETGVAHMAVPEWGHGWTVISCDDYYEVPADYDDWTDEPAVIGEAA